MLIVLYTVVAIVVLCLSYVLFKSPGKIDPLRDIRGNIISSSLSEKVWLKIGGIEQGMFIRGENPNNPIILYLHGGPGVPMLLFISYLEKIGEININERLEKYFTICYWEQRGAGMTYSRSKDSSTLTLKQMVEVTFEVTEYLKKRFNQEKIYLMGQSWGSYLGVNAIKRRPEDYLAYIGVGQTVNFVESERLSYAYMLNHAKEINDNKAVEKLEKYDPYAEGFPLLKEKGHELDYLITRVKLVGKYGIGHMHKFPRGMSYFKGMFVTLLDFKGYTLNEKISWFFGTDFSMIHLFPPMVAIDLFKTIKEFDIPFYIAQGVYDYQTSQVLAERYLKEIKAPKKEFFSFTDSAHSPNLEEYAKFVEVFRKIATENPLRKQ